MAALTQHRPKISISEKSASFDNSGAEQSSNADKKLLAWSNNNQQNILQSTYQNDHLVSLYLWDLSKLSKYVKYQKYLDSYDGFQVVQNIENSDITEPFRFLTPVIKYEDADALVYYSSETNLGNDVSYSTRQLIVEYSDAVVADSLTVLADVHDYLGYEMTAIIVYNAVMDYWDDLFTASELQPQIMQRMSLRTHNPINWNDSDEVNDLFVGGASDE